MLDHYEKIWNEVTRTKFYWAFARVPTTMLYLSEEDATKFVVRYYKYYNGRVPKQHLFWALPLKRIDWSKIDLEKLRAEGEAFRLVTYVPRLRGLGFYGIFGGNEFLPLPVTNTFYYWCQKCGLPVFSNSCINCT